MPGDASYLEPMSDGARADGAASLRSDVNGLAIVDSPALDRVLTAGVDLFYQSGFLATTIRQITGRCGMTAPAFYNHFESKEALLHRIIGDANTLLEKRLEALDLARASSAQALKMLVKTLVEFNLSWPKDARIANREYAFLHAPLRDEVITHRRHVRALFESVLGAADVPQGLLDTVPSRRARAMETRLLAISVINMCITVPDWYHNEGPLSIEAVSDTSCRIALRMALLHDDAEPARRGPGPTGVTRSASPRRKPGRA